MTKEVLKACARKGILLETRDVSHDLGRLSIRHCNTRTLLARVTQEWRITSFVEGRVYHHNPLRFPGTGQKSGLCSQIRLYIRDNGIVEACTITAVQDRLVPSRSQRFQSHKPSSGQPPSHHFPSPQRRRRTSTKQPALLPCCLVRPHRIPPVQGTDQERRGRDARNENLFTRRGFGELLRLIGWK